MDRGDASNRGRDVRYLRFTESQAQVWTPGTFGLLEVPECSGIADIKQADHTFVSRTSDEYILSSHGLSE